jgi:hypothetical protein
LQGPCQAASSQRIFVSFCSALIFMGLATIRLIEDGRSSFPMDPARYSLRRNLPKLPHFAAIT